MDYNDAAEALAWDAAFWLQAFDDPDYQLGKLAFSVGAKLRALGIYGLLATGEPLHLSSNLSRAAGLRVVWLQRARDGGDSTSHHAVLGRLRPVHDALAAGDARALSLMLELSVQDFDGRREYVEDHARVFVEHSPS